MRGLITSSAAPGSRGRPGSTSRIHGAATRRMILIMPAELSVRREAASLTGQLISNRADKSLDCH